MAGTVDPQLLHGRWLRAPEEDTDAVLVYRPAGYPLPPARGREGLELNPDGTARCVGIGRTDLATHRSGRWHLAGDVVTVTFDDAAGDTKSLRITEASRDIMRVQKHPHAR